MKPIIAVVLAAVLISLTGCAGAGGHRAQGSNHAPPASTAHQAGNAVGDSIAGSGQPGKAQQQPDDTDFDIIDAAQFAMDISGSTIPVPMEGASTLTFKDSRTGQVLASAEFRWIRAGNLLKLADPDAVNTWVMTHGAAADMLTFDTKPFPVESANRLRRFKVKMMYEGREMASSSSLHYLCTPSAAGPPCTR
jgi:hypothetical protein